MAFFLLPNSLQPNCFDIHTYIYTVLVKMRNLLRIVSHIFIRVRKRSWDAVILVDLHLHILTVRPYGYTDYQSFILNNQKQ
jgi:hypothetical protein